jgi:hypothetical protein
MQEIKEAVNRKAGKANQVFPALVRVYPTGVRKMNYDLFLKLMAETRKGSVPGNLNIYRLYR